MYLCTEAPLRHFVLRFRVPVLECAFGVVEEVVLDEVNRDKALFHID